MIAIKIGYFLFYSEKMRKPGILIPEKNFPMEETGSVQMVRSRNMPSMREDD